MLELCDIFDFVKTCQQEIKIVFMNYIRPYNGHVKG